MIRDYHGNFQAGANHFFPHVADAESAELQACLRGLQVAQKIQIKRVLLEVDSTGVAAKLVNEGCDRSIHGNLVEEIKVLLRDFDESSVRAVRRTANEAAHNGEIRLRE